MRRLRHDAEAARSHANALEAEKAALQAKYAPGAHSADVSVTCAEEHQQSLEASAEV